MYAYTYTWVMYVCVINILGIYDFNTNAYMHNDVVCVMCKR